jgi:hypothetical protein
MQFCLVNFVIVLLLVLVIEIGSNSLSRSGTSGSTSTITRLRGPAACLPFRPANAEWPRVDLPTWSCLSGAKSANEVAQITNKRTIR